MFLVTTADQRFWREREKVLFLGEWCKIYNQRHVWSGMDHEVLHYHWDDRKKLYRDFLFLNQVYERCLPLLSERLNKFHGVAHSIRYWRILIGPWLNYFIQIFYDRYLSIVTATETGKISNTGLPLWESSDCVPTDYDSFENWCRKDEYNLYLYSWLINALGEIHFEVRSEIPHLDLERSESIVFSRAGLLKNTSKSILEFYARLIPESWSRMVFVSSYLSKWDLASLQVSVGLAPNPCSPRVLAKDTAVDGQIRKELAPPLGSSQFESLLSEIIPAQIPTVYLEGYSEFRERALKAYPKQPKLIYTTNALYIEDGFKIWAAEKLENSAKLVVSQHGGHYGSSLWSSDEQHDIKVSDRYFTWGWADEAAPKEISVPAAQFNKFKDHLKNNPKGGILWVVMSLPRYSYKMFSFPTGPHFLHYLTDQKLFARTVSHEVQKLLMLRLDPNCFGWDEKERWLDIDSSLKVYSGRKTFYQQLLENRLSVHTHNSTTFLETFVANFPTIIFWNPEYFELRSSAKPYYDDLRKVEILHDSPESAAAKVNEIFEDPMSWWMSSEIQTSKDRFCHRFAKTNDDWETKWREELLKIYDEVEV